MCGSIFSPKYDMKIHVESVHEKKKTFKCEICDKNFANKKNMVTHVENMVTHIANVHEGKIHHQN